MKRLLLKELPTLSKISPSYVSADGIFAWFKIPSIDEKTRFAVELMRNIAVYLNENLKKHNDDKGAVLAMITTKNPRFPISSDS